MLRNLLVLFGSTRGTPVEKLKDVATQKNKNYQDHCGLNQVVLLNFGRTKLVFKEDVRKKNF